MPKFIDIVFEGAPDIAPRFIGVEDETGHTINVGTWVSRPRTQTWALRLYDSDVENHRDASCIQPVVPVINSVRADRPQATNEAGNGLKFEAAEFGGECSDMMPQTVTVTDWEGRSAVYVPLPTSQQPKKDNVIRFDSIQKKQT